MKTHFEKVDDSEVPLNILVLVEYTALASV